MIRSVMYLSLVGALLVGLMGCNLLKGKKGGDEGTTTAAAEQQDAEVVPAIPEPDGGLAEPVEEGESTAAADALLGQMKTAGLTAEGFKKVGAKFGAKNCIEGTVDSIPVMMCEYADADAAKANKDKAVEYAKGMPTGVVERNGKTLLAAKANKELDKNGDKLNKIVQEFNKAK
jgi:hypothetical protein